MAFGIDPKFAPLVVILIVILLGFFVLQLVGDDRDDVSRDYRSLQSGALFRVLALLFTGLIVDLSAFDHHSHRFSWAHG